MGICSSHFSDRYIKKFIDKNISETFCDYCEDEKPSANFDKFYEFIEEAIYYEYVEPYESSAPYDPEPAYYQDRFPGLTVKWKYELIDELLDTYDYSIVEDVAASFPNDFLVERDRIWGPTKNEYFSWGWEKFKEIIKHKVRFLFFDSSLKTSFEDEYDESLNPTSVLDELRKAINELELIVYIPLHDLNVYRVRQHSRMEYISSAEKLGAAPNKSAKANRMSPAGISMFYGALDVETAKKEVINDSWKNSATTTAEFVNIKPLRLIDFTSLTEVPSLFDKANRHKRSIMGFILAFIGDLSLPVQPDDSVHIEYVPTQVVTEYLRLKLGNEYGVNGIFYNSVKNPGGKCAVIFADNEQSIDHMRLSSAQDSHLLVMLNDSIITEFI
ncbi:RES domain-containing protein [Chryseotalea sanaruensis]|uniref:RES domain-containing protein n=1 Tax=Chryseotalea sanaruensis TaxID=2482724 RepID=A0A401U6B2_9BACT|nr:HEPN-associated N-terminal domain-containing protein [Chryseotalea sanaruensis]GCC50336.1 RES domain-containing protein [Chryseotalea sanaruensis]